MITYLHCPAVADRGRAHVFHSTVTALMRLLLHHQTRFLAVLNKDMLKAKENLFKGLGTDIKATGGKKQTHDYCCPMISIVLIADLSKRFTLCTTAVRISRLLNKIDRQIKESGNQEVLSAGGGKG